MPATYEPIASTTLGSDSASVTFGSGGTLAQGYTDLILVAQQTQTSGGSPLRLRFTGDTGSNYSTTQINGNGSRVESRRYQETYLSLDFDTSSTSTSATAHLIQVMSYSNSNVFKTVLSAAARGAAGVDRHVGLWRSTSAITSLTVVMASGSFKSGSTFSLYGIKAA